MRPLELNIASRPFSNNTLVWLAYIGLLAAAIGFSYWNVSSFRHYRAELAALDREQGNMAQEQSDLTDRHRQILAGVNKFDRVAIVRRTTKANEVIDWRAFSWTRLFNRLEGVLPSNIKMTSIRPIFRGRDREADEADPRVSMPVKVEGLARDWDALFKLETDLIENESFGRVLPRNIDKRDNGELAFSIEFTYYPDEPIAASDSAALEDVAQAATPGPPPTPQAAGEPAEVTDEWLAQGQAEAPAETSPKAQPANRNSARQPARRTLPKVQPDPADSDDEGEPR